MALFLMLMGPQGAGKGVQAREISAGLDILHVSLEELHHVETVNELKQPRPHVSTGDLFRAMRQREDDLAREVQATMAAGHLINDDLTNKVLRDRLEQPDARTGAVLDGYPRNLVQADFLDKYLAERGERLDAVLLLDLDLFEAFRRSYGRITAADGRSYNIYSHGEEVDWEFVEHPERAFPPQLKARLRESGEALIRRPDDAHAHAIIQRIELFLAEKEELVAYYEERGILRRIDAVQDIGTVTLDITHAAIDVIESSLAEATS